MFRGRSPLVFRGRFHWITIVNVSGFPASYLTELVEWSYRKAFASLSNARQSAIRAQPMVLIPVISVLLGDLHTVPRGPGANQAVASRRQRAGAGTCLPD